MIHPFYWPHSKQLWFNAAQTPTFTPTKRPSRSRPLFPLPKEPKPEKRREATYKRLDATGRRQKSFLEREFWWRGEVLHFLKARSRAISIHDYESEKELVDAGPHEVMFSTREPKQKKPAAPPTIILWSGYNDSGGLA